jgi:hypothetical protein
MVSQLQLNAQAIIFQEDFDGISGPTAGGPGTYAFPSGWILANVDNRNPDANVSYINEAWERREDFANNTADSCAFSTSWTDPVGVADDWMWTPAINIPAGTASTLSWNAVTYDPLYPDGYEVRVMVAPNVPTGSAGLIGNMVTNSTQIFTIAAENTTWTAHTVSLAAYAGQTIRIAFRNNSNNMFVLLIDDITVTQPISDDIQLLSTSPVSQYTIMPEAETTPLTLAGTISNVGSSTATNVRLQATVLRDGVQVYQASSPGVASLAPAATSTLLTVPAYTPTLPGTYVVNFEALMTATDQVPANNTASQTRTVERYTYARDNGIVTGGLGIGAGNGGYVGIDYDLPNAGRVGSVSVFYTQGYTGQPHGIAVFDMVSGIPVNLIHTTSPATYTDDSARLYTVPFPSNINLASGRYLFAAIEYDSTVQVGQTNDIFTAGTAWVNWPTTPLGGWANVEAFGPGFAKPFIIRPNFCPNRTLNLTTTDVLCGQPNSGTAAASIADVETPLTYAWSTGSTAPNVSALMVGTYTCTVTDAFFCTYTGSVNVTAQVPPTVTITGLDIICAGTLSTLTAVGGNTYSWSTGANTANITVSTAGNYSVTVTDGVGCTASNSFDVQVIALPTPAITVNGNTLSTPSNSGSTYQWFLNGNPLAGEVSSSITGTQAGNYTVLETNAQACNQLSSAVSFVPVGLNTVYVLSLSVYPNPVQDNLNIVGFENTQFDYSVFNTMGQEVAKGTAYNQVNVGQLPAGCYFLRLHTNNQENTYQTMFIKD